MSDSATLTEAAALIRENAECLRACHATPAGGWSDSDAEVKEHYEYELSLADRCPARPPARRCRHQPLHRHQPARAVQARARRRRRGDRRLPGRRSAGHRLRHAGASVAAGALEMTHVARIEKIEDECRGVWGQSGVTSWERERLAEWKQRPALTEKQEEILQQIEKKVFGDCDNVKVRGPEAALSPEAPSRLPGSA